MRQLWEQIAGFLSNLFSAEYRLLVLSAAGILALIALALWKREVLLQRWRRFARLCRELATTRRPPLAVLIPAAVVLVLIALWLVPAWEVSRQGPLTADKHLELVNAYRATWAQIIGGLVLLFGLYLTWRRIIATEEGQITERFTRAIDQLGAVDEHGKKKLEIRLGGIYALERIAKDSPKDHWQVMEILTAYVRENAPWKEGPENNAEEQQSQEKRKPATDIQAVLTVLGRRSNRDLEGDWRLDLGGTDLRRATLVGAHLERANLWDAHLEGADLRIAHLERATLFRSHMEMTNLWKAHLEQAILLQAHLEQAALIQAHLEGANLREARLRRAILLQAHLERTDFGEAHLEGANLTDATGLTKEQMQEAHTDEHTKLPDYLQPQEPGATDEPPQPGPS